MSKDTIHYKNINSKQQKYEKNDKSTLLIDLILKILQIHIDFKWILEDIMHNQIDLSNLLANQVSIQIIQLVEYMIKIKQIITKSRFNTLAFINSKYTIYCPFQEFTKYGTIQKEKFSPFHPFHIHHQIFILCFPSLLVPAGKIIWNLFITL